MTDELMFVDYYKYCETCKYKELSENKYPCDECLGVPARYGTRQPEKWEEAKK